MKKRRYVFITLAVLFIALTLTILLREESIDLSADEAPFGTMEMPPQTVGGVVFMDGGSVWVLVIDAKGAHHDLAFQFDDSAIGTKYPTAYHGAQHSTESSAIPLKNPTRARAIALILLRQHGELGDDGTYDAMRYLAEKEPSIGTKLTHKFLSIWD